MGLNMSEETELWFWEEVDQPFELWWAEEYDADWTTLGARIQP